MVAPLLTNFPSIVRETAVATVSALVTSVEMQVASQSMWQTCLSTTSAVVHPIGKCSVLVLDSLIEMTVRGLFRQVHIKELEPECPELEMAVMHAFRQVRIQKLKSEHSEKEEEFEIIEVVAEEDWEIVEGSEEILAVLK